MWEYRTVQNKTKFMDASHTQKQILYVRPLWWKIHFCRWFILGLLAIWEGRLRILLISAHAAHLPEQNGWFSLLTKPHSLAGCCKTRYFVCENQVRHSGSRAATIRNPEKAISYWIPDLAGRRRTRPVWRFSVFPIFFLMVNCLLNRRVALR